MISKYFRRIPLDGLKFVVRIGRGAVEDSSQTVVEASRRAGNSRSRITRISPRLV